LVVYRLTELLGIVNKQSCSLKLVLFRLRLNFYKRISFGRHFALVHFSGRWENTLWKYLIFHFLEFTNKMNLIKPYLTNLSSHSPALSGGGHLSSPSWINIFSTFIPRWVTKIWLNKEYYYPYHGKNSHSTINLPSSGFLSAVFDINQKFWQKSSRSLCTCISSAISFILYQFCVKLR
jgi:hypothetical protein